VIGYHFQSPPTKNWVIGFLTFVASVTVLVVLLVPLIDSHRLV